MSIVSLEATCLLERFIEIAGGAEIVSKLGAHDEARTNNVCVSIGGERETKHRGISCSNCASADGKNGGFALADVGRSLALVNTV